MNRRVLAAAVAVLLAVIGSVLVFSYVSGAERRAMAGMDPVSVLVVAEPIPEGTPAEELAELVATETIPATAVGPGAVSDLDQLSGQVAVTDLVPGEQLLASRFTDPQSLAASGQVEVPQGMHQISVLLDSQRVLGGNLTAGSTVGVFFSLNEDPQTHLALHKVLVTQVQGGITPPPPEAGEEAGAPAAAPMPEGSVMVTLALSPADAERVVFAAEYENIWLSVEDAEVPESGTRIVTRENVYE